MKSLYDQLSREPLNMDCTALLCNTEATNKGFLMDLRDTPAIAEPYTIGDAVRAYLKTLVAKF